MLLLTSTSDKVQLVTTAAVATHVQASWVDNNAGTITPGRLNTIVSTAVTTDIIGVPGASTQRNAKHISVVAVGGAQTCTIQHTDGTTVVQVFKAPLLTGEAIVFTDGNGWQVLDATGAIKNAAAPAAGRYIKTTVYITGSGNHTTDPKTATIFVRLVGGGGGGGGGSSVAVSAACAGGGGGGGYAEKTFTVSPSTAYAYVCGALGTAGANTGGNGGNGGNSTFIVGGTTVTANGGTGGTGQTGGTSEVGAGGGAGGAISTNGDLNGAGYPGEEGWRRSGTVGWSGNGGSSIFGRGGAGLLAGAAGNAGVGPGAGGGGALVLNGGAAALGGAGIAGCVIVDEYT
jgi:hypothetical protein